MLKKIIRVYAFFGTHPIYETLVKYPPRGVQFLHTPSLKTYESLKIYSPRKRSLKDKLKYLIHRLGIPRMIWLPAFSADLIHSSRGFLVLNRKSWVVDIEHIGSFGAFTKTSVKKISIRLLSSNYCKFILPHCKASMFSFFNAWHPPKLIKNKTEVLYPAIKLRKTKKEKHHEIRIGFLATRKAFYVKGGAELVEAFRILSKKYDDIELWLKSEIPEEIRKRCEGLNVNLLEEHFPTREDLFKNFYEKIDVFCLPTYVDSFGYALLEAASVGLPLIATDIFAIPEIIENGKNGFLIHTPLSDFKKNFVPEFFNREILKRRRIKEVIKGLVSRLSLLIEDFSLRRRMGRYNRRLVEKGKFSIKERNKKLKRIYEEAIRR